MSLKAVNKIKNFSLIFLLSLIGLILYLKVMLPKVDPLEDLSIDQTPERITRGSYLANYLCVCTDCHSTRDWSRFSGPLQEGSLGMGGQEFNQDMGFPGKFFSKNITPAKLDHWTDGEIFRAITSGVSKTGKALFPVMPHAHYGKMDREDLYDIIAYLRSLPAIENEVPPAEPDFPMSLLINTIPKPANLSTRPEAKDLIKYGAYLFNAATCGDCHTVKKRGKPVKGMELAGGFEFPMFGGGIVRSANITPDMETGIGTWSESDFITRFKTYADSAYQPPSVAEGDFNTIMPWTMYGQLDRQDLKAIYQYLRTVKPIKNPVVKFSKE